MKNIHIIALSALPASISLIACGSGQPAKPLQEKSAPAIPNTPPDSFSNTQDLIFSILNQPSPMEHSILVLEAAEEQRNNARPAISGRVDTTDYDTIFLGYPTWWMDLPMILYTFLEDYDLSGKTIIPFNTHGRSGFADTINTIAQLEPNAVVITEGLNYFARQGSRLKSRYCLMAYKNLPHADGLMTTHKQETVSPLFEGSAAGIGPAARS